jgi:hypothetical protein
MLGRYTGYRLTELYRFGDLLEEEPADVPGATADHVAATNGVAHNGEASGHVTVQREEKS